MADVMWGQHRLGESFWQLLHPVLQAQRVPAVPRIDCGQCRRAKEGTARWDVRCCDVTPHLPNFLVGELLAGGGHPVLAAWLVERRGDPYGTQVPPQVARAHLDAREGGQYGLACPFLVPGEGRCSIYSARPALCIGYHCYYPNVLWQEAWACLTSLLNLYQHVAARYFVATSGFDLPGMASIWADTDEIALWDGDAQNVDVYKDLWQGWHGREVDFYRSCFQRICDDPVSVRHEMAALFRRQLPARLDAAGQLTPAAEKALWEESRADDAPLTPAPPAAALRKQLQGGAIFAIDNCATLRQQEQTLLWYLQELGVGTPSSALGTLWRWIWPREVAGPQSVGE